MNNFYQDVKHGVRLLIRSPATSAVSILALMLGIGLTTTMFSIVYGALFRGLPFEESDRIVHVEHQNLPRGWESLEVYLPDYLEYRAQQRTFSEMAAFYSGTVNVSGTERAERFEGAFMSAGIFDLLRVKPILGRAFRPDEEARNAPAVVLLGYSLWQTRYDGDRNVIGKTIRANGIPATIIGVMPDKFAFPENQQIWLPLRLDPLEERGKGRTLEVLGRLASNKSIDDAAIELAAIAKRIALEHPVTNKDVTPIIKAFTDEYIGDEPRAMLFTMLGAVFFVLLIGCTNVANLLLGRAILRSKEVGIRTALGASRWRLITQFLSEALVLSLVGALLGTVIALVGIRLFNNAIVSAQPPFWIVIKLDSIALLFVLGLTLLTAIISGTIPALQASRRDVTDVLKDESRGSSSFRLGKISRALVVFEMALSCGLLVGAGLTIKSVVKLRNVNLGFDQERLFTARVGLDESNYTDSIKVRQFFDKLHSTLSQNTALESVALTSSLPGVGEGNWTFGIEGVPYERDQDYPNAPRAAVTPSYFDVLQLRAVEGRLLTSADRAGAMPVMVVSRSFVQKYFNGQSPLGKRIRLGDSRSTGDWMTIVGVVPDASAGDLEEHRQEAMYVPFDQNEQRFTSVIARTNGDPMAVTSIVREAVAAQDPDIPIYFVNTLRGAIAEQTWFYRVFGGLFMIFGFTALLLAAIGLYAVMAFSVSQRTREVGIRMAVGAEARDVMRMILRQGIVQVALGMLLGLAMAAGVSQLLSIILFDVKPRDPTIFASIVVVLSITAVLACLIPARRATTVDPLEALRYE